MSLIINTAWHHALPLVAIIGYLNYPKEWRLSPTILHPLSVAHNGTLIAFSAGTFITLVEILYKHGLVFEHAYYFRDPLFDRVIFFFYLSKYYEFFDTFLIYLSGKKPIFLQQYHHVGAVISWHLMWYYRVDMVWMASLLNSFVHTIMYSYYMCTLYKIHWIRVFKQCITSLQFVQFFLLYSNYYLYYPPVETWFNYLIVVFFSLYGIGIISLFGLFYYKEYVTPRKVK
jgi:GNS1/SUR4 family